MMPVLTNDEDQVLQQEEQKADAWIIKLQRPIRRASSGQYMIYLLVSFVITITLTRLFLGISNYPQLGGGEIHISHILWGGLLLFLATLLMLIVSNRRVYKDAAILAGAGLGLFIDEVGKFITSSYDYFYPIAAPIIYLFFMFLLILAIRLRRQMMSTPRSELHRALEIMQDWIEHPLIEKEREALDQRLDQIKTRVGPGNLANLAESITDVLQKDDRPAPVLIPPRWKTYQTKFEHWVSENKLRQGLAIGVMVMAIVALNNPVSTFMSSRFPDLWAPILELTHSGRWFGIEAAPGFFQARVILETILGALLFASSLLLFYKRTHIGIPLAFGSLILYLVAINPLLFYFEQFSTVIMVVLQFILISSLIYYRTHFMNGNE